VHRADRDPVPQGVVDCLDGGPSHRRDRRSSDRELALPGRYATYNITTPPTEDEGFWAVEDERELVGYCCFGAEARVPGVEAETGTLDVGYGLRPDLVGLRRGRDFVEAILAFGTQRFTPDGSGC